MSFIASFRSALDRGRRAFSLIELAVVLIVVSVIAAIAIPTFQAVVDRAELRSAIATQEAVARDVVAILAFQDPADTPESALTTALQEAGIGAATPGVSAAGVTLVESTVTPPNPSESPGIVTWSEGGGYLAWATYIEEGRGVKCRIVLGTSDYECWGSGSDAAALSALDGPEVDELVLDDDGEGPVEIVTTTITTSTTTSTTTTTIPAPPQPSGLTATSGDASVTLNWSASAGATGYAVYLASSASYGAAAAVATPVSNSTVVSGLPNGTQFWFWVVASGPGGASSPSVAASATPATPLPSGVFVLIRGGAGAKSADGTNWSPMSTSTTSPGWVAASGTNLVVGSGSAGPPAYTSANAGSTWTSTGQALAGAGGHQGGVVKVGSSTVMWASNSDVIKVATAWPATWANRFPNGGNVNDVATNGTVTVLATQSGLYTSSNLSSWTLASGTSGTAFSTVGYNGTRFLAVPRSSAGGAWRSSISGLTWSNYNRSTTVTAAAAITGSNGTFVAYANNQLIRSGDNTTWSVPGASVMPSGLSYPSVSTDGAGRWLVTGSVGTTVRLAVSFDDGVTWSSSTQPGTTVSSAWVPS